MRQFPPPYQMYNQLVRHPKAQLPYWLSSQLRSFQLTAQLASQHASLQRPWSNTWLTLTKYLLHHFEIQSPVPTQISTANVIKAPLLGSIKKLGVKTLYYDHLSVIEKYFQNGRLAMEGNHWQIQVPSQLCQPANQVVSIHSNDYQPAYLGNKKALKCLSSSPSYWIFSFRTNIKHQDCISQLQSQP